MSYFKPIDPQKIIPVITEFRSAYLAAKFTKDFTAKRYRPEVKYFHNKNTSCWEAYLTDTWIENPQPNQFIMARRKVPGSLHQANSASMVLQELLNFTKLEFI